MGDDSINSPGQLRLFEADNGWLPDNTAGGTTATDTGGTNTGLVNTNPPGSGSGETGPYTWQQSAQKAGLANGDYFSHDNKLYQRRDGSTFLVTGDPNGDVKLDDEQTGQLEKARAERAERQSEIEKLDYTNDGSLGIAATGTEDYGKVAKGFIEGLYMEPKGDNPYEGLDKNQVMGRAVGSWIPGWDKSAQAGSALEGIYDKVSQGKPIEAADMYNLIEKEKDLVKEIAPAVIARRLAPK